MYPLDYAIINSLSKGVFYVSYLFFTYHTLHERSLFCKNKGMSSCCVRNTCISLLLKRSTKASICTTSRSSLSPHAQSEKNNPACHSNGDEERVPFFAAQYTKGLEHDTTTGLLTDAGQQSYKELITAMNNGNQSSFNAITLAGPRKLVNPQGGLTFSLEGRDSSLFILPEFPKLKSKKAAALLIELYLMELCRDVYFNDYGTGRGTDATGTGGSWTNMSAAVLEDLGCAYTGPRNAQGIVDASVLFRGTTYGNLVGPYISQFLLLPLNLIPKSTFPGSLGLNNLSQGVFTRTQLQPIPAAKDFVVSYSDFIAVQNGTIPQPYTAQDYNATQQRYLIDGHDFTGYVHFDCPNQEYYNVLNILFSLPFPFSPTNPYANGTAHNEGGFVTFGYFDAYAMIGTVLQEAGKAAWAQKWRVQRALRPEEFAGLVHTAKTTGTNPFKLDSSLFKRHVQYGISGTREGTKWSKWFGYLSSESSIS